MDDDRYGNADFCADPQAKHDGNSREYEHAQQDTHGDEHRASDRYSDQFGHAVQDRDEHADLERDAHQDSYQHGDAEHYQQPDADGHTVASLPI